MQNSSTIHTLEKQLEIFINNKDLSGATTTLEKLIELEPKAIYYCKLGYICLEQGHHQQATNHFFYAIKRNPDLEEAKEGLKKAQTEIDNDSIDTSLSLSTSLSEDGLSALLEQDKEYLEQMGAQKVSKLWKDVLSADQLAKGNPEVTYKKHDLISENKDLLSLTFANYDICHEIARGGMGIVYKGFQKSLKREVAIKKILKSKEDAAKQQRFIAESLVTAYLDHPNIVPVHEIGTNQDGEISLAMKLVGGTSWKELLCPKENQKVKPYDLQGHLQILLSVSNAVAFAHSKEVVHNDLKPSNIMVGEFGEVLVMDWGLAVDIGEKDTESIRGLHKSVVEKPMGTPCYIPPELAEGRGNDIGPWTDVYLLGAILYEIIMKRPPHPGKPIIALLSSISGRLPEFDSAAPEGLKEICHKALIKNISKR